MRCFIAVELDTATRRPLVKLLRDEFPRTRDVRWCTERQLHVTLKFLGDVEPADIEPVCAVIRAASARVAPFEIGLETFGAFPDPRRPRVLWCGIRDETQGCRRWLELADPLLGDLGFAREDRAFSPHVTLGRAKSPAGSNIMREQLERLPPPGPHSMVVSHVTLFESRLKPTGAEYHAVLAADLGTL